jgi:NAD-dependent deacetylase
VWDFYEMRREMMRDKKPNPGHYALAELERRFTGMVVVTQNIDDLHEQAGSQNIIHLHGRISGNKCFYNCQGDPTPVDISKIEWDKSSGPPPCPHCGRWVRPDVVWFNEMLPHEALTAAQQVSFDADVMLVIGTSGLVYPAANLPSITQNGGGKIIEVNPDYGMITRFADVAITAPSGEALPKLVELLDQS